MKPLVSDAQFARTETVHIEQVQSETTFAGAAMELQDDIRRAYQLHEEHRPVMLLTFRSSGCSSSL